MNRRGFLKTLFGAAAGAALAPTLGRVYSFPTNIRLANLAEIDCLYDETGQLNEWEPVKRVAYLFGKDAMFVANLNAKDTPLYSLGDKNLCESIVAANSPSTCYILFRGPSVSDPLNMIEATEAYTTSTGYEAEAYFTYKTSHSTPRRICHQLILPATSI